MADPAFSEIQLSWLRTTANDLNNHLHVISEAVESLERLHGREAESVQYLQLVKASANRAGLAVRGIVERGGGQASLHEGGTSVIQETPARKAGPLFEIENPEGPRELILMVDDEEFITLLARHVLAEDGYKVITARNGFQAIEIFKELKDSIALVILDFVMPVMDGADVFAELRQIKPGVSVVLSSGFAEQDRLRGMLANGLRGFIPKPYTQKKLLEQVRQTLDALQAERR